ncbi:MAG: hypothetical protein DRI39_09155 [Chloroflexi bacterium]|nr:MAG: hypothetical protein DRI39_09155 [Chloroflexota bacterium]
MTTIVLAEDRATVRQIVRLLLEDQPDFTVVGEASNGNEAICLVNEVKPEVLVLDLMLGDMTGFEVTPRVKEGSPQTKVVIFSIYGNNSYVLRAQRAGADGYVRKKTPDKLATAIREVAAGGQYFP